MASTPESPFSTPLLRARQLAQSGDHAEAVIAWREAREASPGILETHLGLAEALRLTGDIAAARATVEDAVRLFPTEPRPSISRAYLDLHQARWTDAFERFHELSKAFPQEASVFVGLSEALEGLGRFEEAYDLARLSERAFDEPWTKIRAGLLAVKRGNTAEGLARISAALDVFGDQPEVRIAAGEALVRVGLREDGERVLLDATRRFPHSVAAHVAYARDATTRGDWDEALRRWDLVVQIDPNNATALAATDEARQKIAYFQLPVVVVYGGCQAEHIAKILNRTPGVNESFRFLAVLNHAPLGEKIADFPADVERATLYWEQYDERAEVPIRERLRAALPASCKRVTFAPTIFMGFWPFAWADSRNVPESGFPFGRYPWGDRIGVQIAKRNLPTDQILDEYLRISTVEMPNVWNLLSRDLDLQERRDAASDVKIGDFVKQNLLSKYQFWTWGHPSALVLGEITHRLIQQSADELESGARFSFSVENSEQDLAGTGNEQLPLHPKVISDLGLQFRDAQSTYNWMGQSWTFEEYIVRYITFDTNW